MTPDRGETEGEILEGVTVAQTHPWGMCRGSAGLGDHRVVTFGWGFGWIIKVTTPAWVGESFVPDSPWVL